MSTCVTQIKDQFLDIATRHLIKQKNRLSNCMFYQMMMKGCFEGELPKLSFEIKVEMF